MTLKVLWWHKEHYISTEAIVGAEPAFWGEGGKVINKELGGWRGAGGDLATLQLSHFSSHKT